MSKIPSVIISRAREIVMFETYEDYDVSDIIEILKASDQAYFNEEAPFITDDQYDALKKYAEKLAPHESYFTGIGAEVRGGKIKLPYPMGSLDQVDVGDISNWVYSNNLQDEWFLITDKLDGTSAMVIYDKDGNLQIAYSRGDGVQGADITRHVRKLSNIPVNIGTSLVVRGEVIISKTDFPIIQGKIKSRSGSAYKNARNMTAGLMNAESNSQEAYAHIRFVAYEVIGSTTDKNVQLHELSKCGFEVPVHTVWNQRLTDEALSSYLQRRRLHSQYEIDGIVIDVNNAARRQKMNPTRETLNPAHTIKYKVADASNLAESKVVAVHWNPSKHGYLKPRVEIEPVELVGVTVTYATGFNAKFIVDNGIGPGAIIQITRSGDVIPFILKTVAKVAPQLPNVPYVWVENDTSDDVDIMLENHEAHEEVRLNRLTDFFAAIEAPLLRKGSIAKLIENGIKTIEDIIILPQKDFVRILGENGRKAHSALRDTVTEIPLYKLLGAFSNERGIGVRKMKKLFQKFGADLMKLDEIHGSNTVNVIGRVEGFDTITAQKVCKVLPPFRDFVNTVIGYVVISYENTSASGALNGKKIVFTGFRDKNLQAEIEAAGGVMQSAVSGQTDIVVAVDPTSNSGKLKKARELGKQIIGMEDIKLML